MSRFRQQQSEAAKRAQERRQREDDAPRLLERVPTLESLSIEIQEVRSGTLVSESKYLRRIPVEHAPALIEVPCMDPTCEDGGYDVSQSVLSALRAGQTRFEGDESCRGRTKTANCQRQVHWIGTATYKGP